LDDQEAILNHLVQHDIEIDDKDRVSPIATTNLKNISALNREKNSYIDGD
jgi:uncharacterized protein YabE (DUF348 family)